MNKFIDEIDVTELGTEVLDESDLIETFLTGNDQDLCLLQMNEVLVEITMNSSRLFLLLISILI